jgi:hypothetical protein
MVEPQFQGGYVSSYINFAVTRQSDRYNCHQCHDIKCILTAYSGFHSYHNLPATYTTTNAGLSLSLVGYTEYSFTTTTTAKTMCQQIYTYCMKQGCLNQVKKRKPKWTLYCISTNNPRRTSDALRPGGWTPGYCNEIERETMVRMHRGTRSANMVCEFHTRDANRKRTETDIIKARKTVLRHI